MGEFADKAKGAAKEFKGEVKQHSSDPETRAEGTADRMDDKIDKAKGSMKGAMGDKV
jgi:uncharacterized protein YjbJ (UPF0337 family)